LLGTPDEATPQLQLELQAHIASCGACAVAAADEAAFRAAMASRPVLTVRSGHRAAMMTVPPPGFGRLLWRRRLTRAAPIAAATVAVLLGSWYIQARVSSTAIDQVVETSPGVESSAGGVPLARAAAPVRRLATAPASATPAPTLVVQAEAPAPTPAPVVVIVVPAGQPSGPGPAPVAPVTGGPAATGIDPGDSGDSGDSGEEDSSGIPAPTATAPSTTLANLTVQAVTDLAGDGPSDCPGCDGITPPDMAAARLNPVASVLVRLQAIDADGAVTDLGLLTLSPTDASTAAASATVPDAARYVVTFEGADGGFVLCAEAAPQITLVPTEGGLFATFRLWRGCPVG
jgi:hypothetical protein